ncbi:hypothetical protein CPB83DRAFT_894665 [Crepidotus variabilis]|uniref:Uncharacterized protein n=1 Tax=Crepidotus variabilis TaxID=179855 RepID=A0A9P6EFV3_9AGAR|nr:hypothetical protein CPB83DRAFT_894665 [Crepidotus variabilis]
MGTICSRFFPALELAGSAPSIGSLYAPLPSPIHLTLSSVHLTGKIFDLSRMTHLNHGTLTIPDIIHILSISPQLISLSCSVSPMWFNHLVDREYAQRPIADHPFAHSSLKSLKVAMYVQHLFARITLPALEILDCCLNENEYNALFEFLCRSQCPLKNLSLYLTCPEDRLIELLHLTPNLQNFHFHSNLTPDFFRYFGETADLAGDRPLFLPQLQTLRFLVPYIFDGGFPLPTLRVVLSHQDGKGLMRPSLSKVVIDLMNDQELTEGEQSELLDLIESGLEIEIYRLIQSNDPTFLSNYPVIVRALAVLRARTAK